MYPKPGKTLTQIRKHIDFLENEGMGGLLLCLFADNSGRITDENGQEEIISFYSFDDLVNKFLIFSVYVYEWSDKYVTLTVDDVMGREICQVDEIWNEEKDDYENPLLSWMKNKYDMMGLLKYLINEKILPNKSALNLVYNGETK